MCEGLLITLFLCEDWQHGLEVQRALLHTFSSACPPDVILLYRYIKSTMTVSIIIVNYNVHT